MSEALRAAFILVASLLLALAAAAGRHVFAGLPGAIDYISSNQSLVFAADLLIVLVVVGGTVGLLYFASR